MLPLPSFDLLRPETAAEAARLLADAPDTRIISGGTDLLPSMKYGLFTDDVLLSTSRIAGLREIVAGDRGGLSIGAGATLRCIGRHPLVLERYPALAAACATVATPTIQAMATLGGNVMLDTRCVWYNQSTFWRGALGGCLKCEGDVCHVAPKGTGCYAAHSADTVPVLGALDARAELTSVSGVREVPIRELYDVDGRSWIRKQPDELLTRVLIPAPPRARITFRKLRARGAIDYPLLLTVTRVDLDEKDRPTGGRIVLSAIGPQPVEVEGVDALLARGDLEAAAELAYKKTFPLATHVWSSTWRKKMVRVEVRRALGV
jgi:4-hydroxybenzoyl-CoA reductase subunit beta